MTRKVRQVACSPADPSLVSEVRVGNRHFLVFGLGAMLEGIAALGISDETELRAELLRQAGERGRIPWGLEDAAADALLVLYRRRQKEKRASSCGLKEE